MGVAPILDLLEKHYDELVDEIRQSFPNIDLNLLLKTFAIESSLMNNLFYLTTTYKNEIDIDMKDEGIYCLTETTTTLLL